jgi:pimeloyl-ACP methyl ester carboxylesterase
MDSFWKHFYSLTPEKTNDICVSSIENDKENEKIEAGLLVERAKTPADWEGVGQDFATRKGGFPVMIDNCYGKGRKTLEIEEILPRGEDVSLHLVVLVHGFQGNSMDMKLIKNTMSVVYPEAAFLCATSNEDLTDTDIIEMGNRLAAEVKNHIIEFFPPDSLQRLSFVGHSLGGVIIRAALPRLLDLKDKFHALLTFSSPHLGYKVNTSSVIEAGIWVLQKFKNSNCLKQLTMHDNLDPRECCLYRISRF